MVESCSSSSQSTFCSVSAIYENYAHSLAPPLPTKSFDFVGALYVAILWTGIFANPSTWQRTSFAKNLVGGCEDFLILWKAFHCIQNFRRQKSTMFGKNFLENFSLYLLGHLRAKNQRSEKYLSLIRNFGGVKFNRLWKNLYKTFSFPSGSRWKRGFVHISGKKVSSVALQVVADEKAVFRTTFKIFLCRFLPRCEDQKCQPSEKIFFGIKNAPSIFLKNESAGLLRYSVVGWRAKLPPIQVGNIFWTFFCTSWFYSRLRV